MYTLTVLNTTSGTKTAEVHIQRCRDLGSMVDANMKFYRCIVPGCKVKKEGVTRKDNLKSHYQKTHFFEEKQRRKDGSLVGNKKRNIWLDPEVVEKVLGLGEWDAR